MIGQFISFCYRPTVSGASILSPDIMADSWSPDSAADYMANVFSKPTTNNLSNTSTTTYDWRDPPTEPQCWHPGNATRASSNSSTSSLPGHINSTPSAPPSNHPKAAVRAQLWQRITGWCADHRISNTAKSHAYLCTSPRSEPLLVTKSPLLLSPHLHAKIL